ncbi:hypothetical protein FS749_010173 [Ceratobasidium sp. UAMH 11750]|nr:hypothetical protein FS749_010173 [Ceratobasidium sp. UAMH 11750]
MGIGAMATVLRTSFDQGGFQTDMLHVGLLLTPGHRGRDLDFTKRMADHARDKGLDPLALVGMLCTGSARPLDFARVIIEATISCFSENRPWATELERAWAADALAPSTDLHIAQNSASPYVLQGVDFTKCPWGDYNLLPSCSCPEPKSSAARARGWKLRQAMPKMRPTKVDLACTWCSRVVSLVAPTTACVILLHDIYVAQLPDASPPPAAQPPRTVPSIPQADSSDVKPKKPRKRKRGGRKVAEGHAKAVSARPMT